MGWPWRLSLCGGEGVRGRHAGRRRRVDAAWEGGEPLFKILNARYPPLRITDHLGEEVCEARLAEFGRLAAVQRPVVYGLAARRVPQAGLIFCRRLGGRQCARHREGSHWRLDLADD